MRSLIIKDILIQKRLIIVMGLYSLFFFILFGLLDEPVLSRFVYILNGTIVALVITLGSFKGDRKGSENFTASLPVSRREIAGGKFAVLFLGAVYGIATAGLIGLVLRFAAPRFCDEILSLRAILGVFIGAAICSFVIPLALIIGQTGMKIILVSLLSVTVAANIMTLVSSSGSAGHSLVSTVIRSLEEMGVAGRFRLFGFAGAAILALSAAGSLLFYPKKNI